MTSTSSSSAHSASTKPHMTLTEEQTLLQEYAVHCLQHIETTKERHEVAQLHLAKGLLNNWRIQRPYPSGETKTFAVSELEPWSLIANTSPTARKGREDQS